MALTPAERLFIRKAHETRTVQETTLLRDAVMNAEYNVNRKKGKPFKKLWNRIISLTQAERKDKRKDIEKIREIEKRETEKNWIRRIYEANGWVKKKGGT